MVNIDFVAKVICSFPQLTDAVLNIRRCECEWAWLNGRGLVEYWLSVTCLTCRESLRF